MISNNTLKLFIVFTLLLSGFGSVCAQAKTQAYCDSIIKEGVNAILNEKDYVKAIELLQEAHSMAEQRQWYEQQFLALNNIGIMYYVMFDYGEALNYYLKAYTISLKHLEDQQTMIVLNNIAILYSKEKNYLKAMDYFSRAYDMAKKNDDHIKIGFYAINLGIICNKTGQLDSAESYFKEALLYISDRPEKYLEARSAMTETIMLRGDFKKTISECKVLLTEAEQLEYTILKNELLILMSSAYLNENDLINANYYASRALTDNTDMENKAEIYSLLSDISYKRRDFQNALLYKDSITFMHDSLNYIKNGRLYENSKIKFELQNYQHELSLKETQLISERKFFYAILGIILVILVFFFWWIRNRSIKQRQKRKIEEDRRRIIELELEKEKSEYLLLEKQLKEKETLSLLEQERLKSEIELRNRQLSAKALFLSGRDQLIEELLIHLSKVPGLSNDEIISSQLKNIKNQLNSEKEWGNFVSHFEEVNQGILASLKQKHPDLNSNDLRFISYIYMNMSTKEIASMLNITVDACRKRRERITRKMNLDGENSLHDYLFS